MFASIDLHRKRTIISWAAVAATVLLSIQPGAAQVGLGLSPMRVEIHVTPGTSYTGSLRLVNEGAAVRARTSLLDFHLDTDQTPQFQEQFPEEAAYSCRPWLTVNPMETELSEKGEALVRYTIRVPANVPPRSYYCAAGFVSMPPAAAARGLGLQTAVRVVAAFYVIVGSPAIQGQLSEITVEHIPGTRDLRAVLVLENSGNMFFRPLGSLTIQDPSGKVLEKYEVTPVPILPERKQRLLFPLKIAEGQPCTIRVSVDLGTGEIQEGSVIVPAASLAQ
jgi:hypothetical protein